jgi:unsaturated chondroitin disaccharide hydrolase
MAAATIGVLVVAIAFSSYAADAFYSTALDSSKSQLARLVAGIGSAKSFPRTINTNGTVKTVTYTDWTSGFFAGCLWQMYDYTKDTVWRSRASQWTLSLDSAKFRTTTHDVGFVLYCSYGKGLPFVSGSDKAKYEAVLLQGSKSLSTRYHSSVKAIKSWDFMAGYPVIIDNMMNLEMLCHATAQSKDSSFIKIATSHANTTKKNHFRPNYSSYHLVNYDSSTGAVTAKQTVQGYADSSSWARGQAWGLYGYTFMYRETKDTAYLSQACHIADYILNHPRLPADLIPYWDYNAPASSNPPRDASAAAVTASALIELSQILSTTAGATYLQKARTMLQSLCSSAYFATANTNGNFLLKHSTGHLPAGTEIDVPLIYADYYLLEGLLRLRAIDISETKFAIVKNSSPFSSEMCFFKTVGGQGFSGITIPKHGFNSVIWVYDCRGQLVYKAGISSAEKRLALPGLAPGFYGVQFLPDNR